MQSFGEFTAFVERFKWVAALIVGAAGLTPVLAAFAGMDPAWPQGIEAVTSLLIIVTLILSFVFTRGVRAKSKRWVILASALAFVVALFGYLYAFDRLVYTIPGGDQSITLGCKWTKDARDYAAVLKLPSTEQCPGDFDEMLSNAEYSAEAVWTAQSLSENRLKVLALWLTVFTALAAFIGSFVSTMKGTPKKPQNDILPETKTDADETSA